MLRIWAQAKKKKSFLIKKKKLKKHVSPNSGKNEFK